MNNSTGKTTALLVTATAIFSLNYNTPVFSAGLFDDLLEAAVDSATKEIIDSITKSNQIAPKKPTVTPPAASNAAVNTKVKSTITRYKRPTKANHQWKSYKDWSASVETKQDKDGEWITSCAIRTGGDGVSTIGAEISWGNGDPGTMPTVDFNETTYRHVKPMLQGKKEVTWVVSVKNQAFSYPGETYTGFHDSGIPYAINRIQGNINDGDTLELLRAFAKGSTVTLHDDQSDTDLHSASLSGFSASYRKVSEWCGFSPESVLTVAPSATSEQSVSTASLSRPNKAKNIREMYQNWQASVHTFDTVDGDWITNCSIQTGGEGMGSIHIRSSWGDGLPPDAPLTVRFKEATARGYPTRLKKNDNVHWIIDSRYNRDNFYSTYTDAGFNNDGIPYAENKISGNNEFLYSLGHGYSMNLRFGDASKDLYTASLNGFEGAYRRMSQWCGFSANSALR